MKRIKLKALRKRKGLSQTELAALTGISLTTYCMIENGERRGSQEFWLNLKDVLKFSKEEIWDLMNEVIGVED